MWQRKYVIATIIWMGLIWFFSSRPHLHSGLEQDFILRKSAHAVEYGVLTWLAFMAVGRSTKMAVISAALFALMYAGVDEWHQSWVPGRYGTPRDVAIDAVGIVAVASILLFRLRRGRLLADS